MQVGQGAGQLVGEADAQLVREGGGVGQRDDGLEAPGAEVTDADVAGQTLGLEVVQIVPSLACAVEEATGWSGEGGSCHPIVNPSSPPRQGTFKGGGGRVRGGGGVDWWV